MIGLGQKTSLTVLKVVGVTAKVLNEQNKKEKCNQTEYDMPKASCKRKSRY